MGTVSIETWRHDERKEVVLSLVGPDVDKIL